MRTFTLHSRGLLPGLVAAIFFLPIPVQAHSTTNASAKWPGCLSCVEEPIVLAQSDYERAIQANRAANRAYINSQGAKNGAQQSGAEAAIAAGRADAAEEAAVEADIADAKAHSAEDIESYEAAIESEEARPPTAAGNARIRALRDEIKKAQERGR